MFDIAWYEQKAVIVVLVLLYLGVKNIHPGPTLPAFLSSSGGKTPADEELAAVRDSCVPVGDGTPDTSDEQEVLHKICGI